MTLEEFIGMPFDEWITGQKPDDFPLTSEQLWEMYEE
jgi:hypothetical protein